MSRPSSPADDVHPHPHGHARRRTTRPMHHDHGHARPRPHATGLKGWLQELFVPHSHDSADSIDAALESKHPGHPRRQGLPARTGRHVAVPAGHRPDQRLRGTAGGHGPQFLRCPDRRSALDRLSARTPPATRTYTYGFGRAEDLAGLFIVAMIALSAVVAAVESIRRFFEPQPVQNLGWVLAAGLVGFAGNELVAIYRIRVGRRIGSAALVADGIHARTDGFTSLAVVAGVIGIWLGFPACGSDRGPAHLRSHRRAALGHHSRHRAQADGRRRPEPYGTPGGGGQPRLRRRELPRGCAGPATGCTRRSPSRPRPARTWGSSPPSRMNWKRRRAARCATSARSRWCRPVAGVPRPAAPSKPESSESGSAKTRH